MWGLGFLWGVMRDGVMRYAAGAALANGAGNVSFPRVDNPQRLLHITVSLALELVKKLIIVALFLTSPSGTTV